MVRPRVVSVARRPPASYPYRVSTPSVVALTRLPVTLADLFTLPARTRRANTQIPAGIR